MIPIRIQAATRNLGAPPNWTETTDKPCGHLPIRDEVIDGVPYMTSRWEPTPDELADLIAGGPVELRILGTTHPVVSLVVQPHGEPA
jgi:hypothetical protein